MQRPIGSIADDFASTLDPVSTLSTADNGVTRSGQLPALFAAAVELPPGKRKKFVAKRCANSTLGKELLQLLDWDDRQENSLLERPIELSTACSTRAYPPLVELPGYSNLTFITEGGQASVYHAVQNTTDQQVVIKVHKWPKGSRDEHRCRHEKEISILSNLQHPNIVSILDCGVASDGRAYYVARYIAGDDLDAYLSKATLSLDAKVQLCVRIIHAIEAAHQNGIIHRDIKPSNIRIDVHGEPHLLDFGLAKGCLGENDETSAWRTRTGCFTGSVPWASPEQIDPRCGPVSIRSDVYQLGVVCYQIFCAGALPYDLSGGIASAFEKILKANPRPISEVCRNANLRAIDTVVRKALQKNPTDRFATAALFAEALARAQAAREPASTHRTGGKKRLLAALICIVALSVATFMSFVRNDASPSENHFDQRADAIPTDSANSHTLPANTEGVHGSLDFEEIEPGSVPEGWAFQGGVGIDYSTGIPVLGMIAQGADDNLATFSSIDLPAESYLEICVSHETYGTLDVDLLASDDRREFGFKLNAIRGGAWTLAADGKRFSEIGTHVRPNLWVYVENRTEGIYATFNGDPGSRQRIAGPSAAEFSKLRFRFHSQNGGLHVSHLRWGPLRTGSQKDPPIPLGSQPRHKPGLIAGWRTVGVAGSDKAVRYQKDNLKLRDEFDLELEAEIDASGRFNLNLIGAQAGPSLPLHFRFHRGWLSVCVGNRQWQVDSGSFAGIPIRLRRSHDTITVHLGREAASFALGTTHFAGFDRIQIDRYAPSSSSLLLSFPH